MGLPDVDVFDTLRYRVEVDEDGVRRYRNAVGELHREEGPAVVYSNGDFSWYRNGLRHRTNGPASIIRGNTYWYRDGLRHREGGPAVILASGSEYWYRYGNLIQPETDSGG